MTEFISSPQNPKIKLLLSLQQKSSARKEFGLFVVEGKREIEHCLEGGFIIDSVFYCPAIMGLGEPCDILQRIATSVKCFELSPELYNKIAYRGSTEGIIAEVKTPSRDLASLKLGENPLIIVLESVEKPGNIGAVLRSADAAGTDALIICDPLTDLYNPNLIRASIGAVFTVPCVCCSSAECIEYLKANDIKILTAQLQDSELYYDSDMTGATAIVMGTEATGLKSEFRQAADRHIRIPMLGRLDSLNVSVSAAILLFEALRQRRK
ncbi:MAG: TrmH family RNA methyltransferase [Candidatus Cryptobacteroides sp.]